MTELERDLLLDQVPRAWDEEEGAVSFSLACERAGQEPAAVRESLGDEHDLVDAWFARLGDRVIEQASSLSAGLKVEDRLGTLVFTLFDAFEQEDAFVRATFDRHASSWGCPFRDRVAAGLDSVLAGPDVPGLNRAALAFGPVRSTTVELTVQAIGAWLRDPSDRRERATALVDRLVALFAELASNRIADRAADLVKYAAGAGFIPFVGPRRAAPENP